MKKTSVEKLLQSRPESEPRTYFAVDEDLPEIFFKTAEQIDSEEWEELWKTQR